MQQESNGLNEQMSSEKFDWFELVYSQNAKKYEIIIEIMPKPTSILKTDKSRWITQ